MTTHRPSDTVRAGPMTPMYPTHSAGAALPSASSPPPGGVRTLPSAPRRRSLYRSPLVAVLAGLALFAAALVAAPASTATAPTASIAITDAPVLGLASQPNGQLTAVAANAQLVTWVPRQLLPVPTTLPVAPVATAVDPGGGPVYLADAEGAVVVADPASGTELVRTTLPDPVTALAVARPLAASTATTVWAGTAAGQLLALEPATLVERAAIDVADGRLRALAPVDDAVVVATGGALSIVTADGRVTPLDLMGLDLTDGDTFVALAGSRSDDGATLHLLAATAGGVYVRIEVATADLPAVVAPLPGSPAEESTLPPAPTSTLAAVPAPTPAATPSTDPTSTPAATPAVADASPAPVAPPLAVPVTAVVLTDPASADPVSLALDATSSSVLFVGAVDGTVTAVDVPTWSPLRDFFAESGSDDNATTPTTPAPPVPPPAAEVLAPALGTPEAAVDTTGAANGADPRDDGLPANSQLWAEIDPVTGWVVDVHIIANDDPGLAQFEANPFWRRSEHREGGIRPHPGMRWTGTTYEWLPYELAMEVNRNS